MENIGISKKRNKQIIERAVSVLMCAEGFLLFFFHISNGETNIIEAGFASLYYGIPVVLAVLGMVLFIMNRPYAKNSLGIALAAMIYLILRLASGSANGLMGDPGFWKTIIYEAFLIMGINAFTINRKTLRIVLCELLAFDLIAISICTFHYIYLKDAMTSAVEAFSAQLQENIPFTFIFINPNLAGMLAGICASVSILIFQGRSKSFKLMLTPVILVNIIFMIWSNSRTSIVGTAVIVIACLLRRYLKRINYKAIIAVTLILCASFMLPVYITSFASESETSFQNTEIETKLNESASGRYNLWKSHILSQKGHYLLGFGTASKAVKARTDFMQAIAEAEDVDMDAGYQSVSANNTLGVHNGYMELVLVAGVPAALVLMALLLLKIRSMDNGFIERNPVVLLLIMLFWISVQEARFITSSVHYTAFLMMILLSWREEEGTDADEGKEEAA